LPCGAAGDPGCRKAGKNPRTVFPAGFSRTVRGKKDVAGVFLSIEGRLEYSILPRHVGRRGRRAMIMFLEDGPAGRNESSRYGLLGPLEMSVMGVLWSRGECSVREVVPRLDRPLAYTTVMTTLDRLYKKGFLLRRKSERAFLYSPLFSRRDWERKVAGDLIEGFLAGPSASRENLLSFLVDAVGRHDEELLEELEKKIRSKRRELCRRSQP
jgi:predicted transcriptional regulator